MEPEDNIAEGAASSLAPQPGRGKSAKKRDLSFVFGTWEDDPEVDEAIAAQDTVDEEVWR
jgi:hypothetical protein